MPNQYNESEIVKKIGSAISKLSSLYKEPYIKWKGKTKDTKELYSEIASKELLSIGINKLFSDYMKILRENYKVSHTGKINETSNRNEEILAIKLKGKELEHLGTILEYQIPLKLKRGDKGVGKIDLVSINDSEHKAFIIELKANNNKKEGLLKAVLEIVTYSYQLNEDKFLEDLSIPYKPIIKSVLLEKESLAYDEACELESRPNLRELIKSLKVEVFLLESRENYTIRKL